MGEHNRLATTGFSKMSDRQMALWDVGNPNEPIGGFMLLDSISGVNMPFWDDGTQCLYLGGKGDGNIRYFEYENDKFEFLSEYKSAEPQRGLAFVPRRGINVHENEIMRAYKTVNDSYIEPISFTVPRRAEVFQSDIYPPAIGLKPAMSATEWLDGKDGLPAKIDLESIYQGNAPVEVASDYKPFVPVSASAPTPVKAPIPRQNEPMPGIQRTSTLSSISEQKSAITAIASKYQDDAGASPEDDASSFEEIRNPLQKSNYNTPKNFNSPSTTRADSQQETIPLESVSVSQTNSRATQSHVSSSTDVDYLTGKSANNDKSLITSLAQIKKLLEDQTITINSQSQQIEKLADQVDTLKTKVGSGSREQSDRILELELELKTLRSETTEV